ncbi:hypothetical protein [Streptomyces ziwulingensis]|uniref:Uncharacterized protein n=1 Tax=Streptomyces ziwulingensis TaxID=1045501 RepID=A0ABP9B4T4_9ACTN
MTTGSSTPRPNEYSIATAADLPAAETTTGTGTHSPFTRGGAPGSQPSAVRASAARAPAGPFDDLHDDLYVDEEPPFDEDREGARAPGRHPCEEPVTRSAPHPDTAAYGDPVGDLVRAAVADRPLEEVVTLITTLQRSPQYARATVDALRAVGMNRSVEDVTRLVGLLTRPPRDADSADEAIRAAAESRPVEDVTRLMALLHRTPLLPHCGEEAVRAAATGRPVEELVRLIGRLGEERPDPLGRPYERALDDPGFDDDPQDTGHGRRSGRSGGALGALLAGAGRGGRARSRAPRRGRTADTRQDRDQDQDRDQYQDGAPDRDPARSSARDTAARSAPLSSRLAVAVLAGCGIAFFPLHAEGTSARAYGVALGLSALCLVLALVLTLRPAVPVLAVAVVGPVALAAGRLYAGTAPGSRPARVMDLTLAPAWIAVTAAAAASLAALTALCVRVAAQPPGRWAARPVAEARPTAD